MSGRAPAVPCVEGAGGSTTAGFGRGCWGGGPMGG